MESDVPREEQYPYTNCINSRELVRDNIRHAITYMPGKQTNSI